MKTAKTVGEKLRDLRNAYGLSQDKFGAQVGIHKGSINSYENNINPLTQTAKWKILQATGVGFEYFDTDMDLSEAFVKYNIDTGKKLAFREIEESVCAVYDGVKSFIEGECTKNPFSIKSWILAHLYGDSGDFCLIKVKQNELEPYAKAGEWLVVLRDTNVDNGNRILAEVDGEILAVQYFFEISKIRLKLASNSEINMGLDEFKDRVKILGIIKAKFAITH